MTVGKLTADRTFNHQSSTAEDPFLLLVVVHPSDVPSGTNPIEHTFMTRITAGWSISPVPASTDFWCANH